MLPVTGGIDGPGGLPSHYGVLTIRRGTAARHVSPRSRTRRQETQGADRLRGTVLFANAIFPMLPHLPAFRLQGVSHRCAALRGGTPNRVMIDNTHVVVLRGSGRDMVPVPEMAAFAERFGFQFVAHAIGNANRSARVERPLSAQFLVMHS